MTILFWYWWLPVPLMLFLMLFSRLALPALCMCALMGSLVRVAPDMPIFLQFFCMRDVCDDAVCQSKKQKQC